MCTQSNWSHPLSHYKYQKPNTYLLLFASVELVFDPFSFSFFFTPFLFLFPKCLLIFNSNSFIFLRLPLNWLGHKMDTWTRSLVFQFYAGRFINEKCTPDTFWRKKSNEKSLHTKRKYRRNTLTMEKRKGASTFYIFIICPK